MLFDRSKNESYELDDFMIIIKIIIIRIIIIIKIIIIIINEIGKKPKKRRYNFITNGNGLIKNLRKEKGKKDY